MVVDVEADWPEMDPLVDELGYASSLFEKKLEEVAGETSTSFYIPKPQLLGVHKWQDQNKTGHDKVCSYTPKRQKQ